MKDRDRRKLHLTLTLIASIAVAVGTALSITYVALGFLIVYVRDNFSVWNEKRKAENELNKANGKDKKKNKKDKKDKKKGPGILAYVKAMLKKPKDELTNVEVKTVVTSTVIPVKPIEFNTISNTTPVKDEKPQAVAVDNSKSSTSSYSSTEKAQPQDHNADDDYSGYKTTSRFKGIKF